MGGKPVTGMGANSATGSAYAIVNFFYVMFDWVACSVSTLLPIHTFGHCSGSDLD